MDFSRLSFKAERIFSFAINEKITKTSEKYFIQNSAVCLDLTRHFIGMSALTPTI